MDTERVQRAPTTFPVTYVSRTLAEYVPGQQEGPVWQIRVRGHLGPQWHDWFDGLTVTNILQGQDAQAILSGPLADQAALHGVLAKVRDLGLSLLAVSHVADDKSEVP